MKNQILNSGVTLEEPGEIEAIKKASKELNDKFMKLHDDLIKESKEAVADVLQAQKLDKIREEMSSVRDKLKENNTKLSEHSVKLATVENDLNQKIAGINIIPEEKKERVVKELSKEAVDEFMRTGSISETKEKLVEYKNIEKATDFTLTGNEFVIPAEIDSQIQEVLRGESGVLAFVDSVRSNTKDYRKLINRGGAGRARAAETTVRGEQDAPLLAEVELSYGELYTWYYVGSHSIDDAGLALEQELINSVGLDFGEQIDHDVFSGTGVNAPKGLNAYTFTGTPEWGKILSVAGGSASGITYQDVWNLLHGVRKAYRRNSQFALSRAGIQNIVTLEDTNGNLIFRPSFNQGRFEETLLGYPVLESDEIADPAPDAVSAYFGNFKRGYLLHFLRELRMLRDPYTKKGYIGFYVWQRYGGGVADFNALVALQQPSGS